MRAAPGVKTAAKNGVESLKKNAAGAMVADLTE